MTERPVYSDGPAILDINPIIIGKDFGPMRLTPSPADPCTGRTHTAAVYSAAGTKLADMVVTVIDAALGIIELSMTKTETAKLIAGVLPWSLSYVYGTEDRMAYSGNVFARAR